nr:YARHG domain-containing protein [uncultured Clostridium sp.]
MKPHPLLPVVLLALSLTASGCKMNSRVEETPSSPAASLTEQGSAEQEQNSTETGKPNTETNGSPVTVRTWSADHNEKYSDRGTLIYRWNSRVPEVIIPDKPDSQYLINRSLRENDQNTRRYEFISDTMEIPPEATAAAGEPQKNFLYTFDYQVLRNDGTLLSLRQNGTDIRGNDLNDAFTFLSSYDVEKGKKITLSALSDDPDGLKLALAQAAAGQASADGSNGSLLTEIMSSDLNQFALLKDGIVLSPEWNADKAGSAAGAEALIPYGQIEKKLNDYGKQLMAAAQKSEDVAVAAKELPEYIFPESSTSCLTGGDLLEADSAVLRLARNEIYARHGRKFDAADLQDYFNSKSWYHAAIAPSDFKEDSLNELEKKNLDLIKTAENQLPGKEISDNGVVLEAGKDYLLDLDGDGVCESLRWSSTDGKEDYEEKNFKLFINGQYQTSIPEKVRGSIRLTALDLNKKDKEIELHLDISQESDSISAFSFYRYRNGSLELIGDLAGPVCGGNGSLFRQSSLRAEGDGLLSVSADTPFSGSSLLFGCYFVDLVFSYQDGKLKEVPQEIYFNKNYDLITNAFLHQNPNNYYVVSRPFPVTTAMEGDTPAFSVSPGETVCPIGWALKDGLSYVLVMNEAGACGWVMETVWDTDPDTAHYLAVPAWG